MGNLQCHCAERSECIILSFINNDSVVIIVMTLWVVGT